MPQEIELKFHLAHPAETRRRLRALGFRQVKSRRREINTIFDAPGAALRRRDTLLRLRESGGEWILTVKGPRRAGPFKSRRELETKVDDGAQTRALLAALGFTPRLSYRRFRTTFQPADQGGELAWDETPMGTFLELEGPRAWIRRAAAGLGLAVAEAEPRSYPALHEAWQRRKAARRAPQRGKGPAHFLQLGRNATLTRY